MHPSPLAKLLRKGAAQAHWTKEDGASCLAGELPWAGRRRFRLSAAHLRSLPTTPAATPRQLRRKSPRCKGLEGLEPLGRRCLERLRARGVYPKRSANYLTAEYAHPWPD